MGMGINEFSKSVSKDKKRGEQHEKSPIPAEHSVDRPNDPAGIRGGDSRGQ
ncbi:hypothetical protein [Bacillus sp. V5-8f]|uniref:hypothetical protein n=1 Tax=Bacillus sp. V5-8f TaxID=2053044 RepID=UPI0015E12132|nr:hypothetical protein [Bacillus sp. V5-8f]